MVYKSLVKETQTFATVEGQISSIVIEDFRTFLFLQILKGK